MSFFQKPAVAIIITVLVCLGCLCYGWYMRPTDLPEPKFGEWYYDGAHILSAETEEEVRRLNSEWTEKYGCVIALATVPNTRNWDLYDYAMTLGHNWGLGTNDMLLLIDRGGGAYQIVFSEAVDDNVDDDVLERVESAQLAPAFRNKSYDIAVQNFYQGMDGCLQTAWDEMDEDDLADYDSRYYDATKEFSGGVSGRVRLGFIIAVIVIAGSCGKKKKKLPCRSCK